MNFCIVNIYLNRAENDYNAEHLSYSTLEYTQTLITQVFSCFFWNLKKHIRGTKLVIALSYLSNFQQLCCNYLLHLKPSLKCPFCKVLFLLRKIVHNLTNVCNIEHKRQKERSTANKLYISRNETNFKKFHLQNVPRVMNNFVEKVAL